MHAALAQLVEHLTRNEKVVSSILTGGSYKQGDRGPLAPDRLSFMGQTWDGTFQQLAAIRFLQGRRGTGVGRAWDGLRGVGNDQSEADCERIPGLDSDAETAAAHGASQRVSAVN